ncbi:MAG: hypothetical protein QOE80_4287 [Actinomycetota bacterium]|nr:hypothetical protein [Actinomycetota bacterium]
MNTTRRTRRHRRPAFAIGLALTAAIASTGVALARFAGPGPGRGPDSGFPVRHFAFGLWGDMPYAKAGDGPKIPALVADMNNDRLAFTAFDGDIKDGSSLCTDDRYTMAIDRFNQFQAPTVYVPGDNEWTDCHRVNDGGYGNLERLDHVRRVMFAGQDSFGVHTMPLVHQGKAGEAYSENTRWAMGDAVFVGLNVPGSNNDKVNDPAGAECTANSVRKQADCEADNAEYAARITADIDWLRQAFAAAKDTNAKGVMVIMQADPGFDLPETAVDERADPAVNGYTDLVNALVEETKAFPGQVVLVHGDRHFFKLDKPLLDQAHLIPNFTRLETFGSPNVDWVKVTADPRSRNYFTFEPMVVAGDHP